MTEQLGNIPPASPDDLQAFENKINNLDSRSFETEIQDFLPAIPATSAEVHVSVGSSTPTAGSTGEAAPAHAYSLPEEPSTTPAAASTEKFDWFDKPATLSRTASETVVTAPLPAQSHEGGRHRAPRRRGVLARIGDLGAKVSATLQETQDRRSARDYVADKLEGAEAKVRAGAKIAKETGETTMILASFGASEVHESMKTAWKNNKGKLKTAGKIALGVAVAPIVLGVEGAKLAARTGQEASRFTSEQITATRISFRKRGLEAAQRKEHRAEERAQNIRTERAAQGADLRTVQQQELQALQAKQARKAPSGRRAIITAAKQEAKINLMQAEHALELDDFNSQTREKVAPHYARANHIATKNARRQSNLTALRMKAAKRKAA